MSKLNINPSIVLACFTSALGSHFEKVCNDTKSFLGRLEKDIKTTGGEWKVTSTGKLRSKDGNEVQLPLNSHYSVLLRFGMQVNELANKADFGGPIRLNEAKDAVVFIGVQCELPKEAQAWFDNMDKSSKQPVTEAVTK